MILYQNRTLCDLLTSLIQVLTSDQSNLCQMGLSRFYELNAGVRQGGVLSPYLFSIFIDDLVKYVNKTNVGCRIRAICTAIFLYADDVSILLAPSVTGGYLCF